MLYDKRWDKPEIKADPFTLESLVAWLEKMPKNGTYCYAHSGYCLFAKYFKAMGKPRVSVGNSTVSFDGEFLKLPEPFFKIAIGRPRTFGAALERAKGLTVQS